MAHSLHRFSIWALNWPFQNFDILLSKPFLFLTRLLGRYHARRWIFFLISSCQIETAGFCQNRLVFGVIYGSLYLDQSLSPSWSSLMAVPPQCFTVGLMFYGILGDKLSIFRLQRYPFELCPERVTFSVTVIMTTALPHLPASAPRCAETVMLNQQECGTGHAISASPLKVRRHLSARGRAA